ncbi:hypothetical protein [Synechococcus sp. W4D4]|uniref:hypothetical protein n=1 Tax=Synechococcus sp. W4D4 TaxID=3392294 RepID=UPI0039ECE7ED
MTVASLCVIPASLILLTCSLLRRQGIPILPIQNLILGSELFLFVASAFIVIASGFYGVLLYRTSKTAAVFPLKRRFLMLLLGSLVSFLVIAAFSGSRYDYVAYQYQWSNILQGKNPWTNLPTGPNAYGPIYNAFSAAYGLHPLLPKALFVIVLFFFSVFLSSTKKTVKIAPLLVALSPFSLSIVAVYGFMDVLPGTLFVLSICLMGRQKDFASGCFMAMSIFSKFYGLLAIPIVILRLAFDRSSWRVWRFAIGLLSVSAVVLIQSLLKHGPSFLVPVIWSGQRDPSLFSIARVSGVEQLSTYVPVLLSAAVFITSGLFFYFRRRVVFEEYLLSLYCFVFALYPLGHQQFALLLVLLLALVWSRETPDECLSSKLGSIKLLIGSVLIAGLMSIQLIFESFSELKPSITSGILDSLSIVYPLLLLVVAIFYLMPYSLMSRDA